MTASGNRIDKNPTITTVREGNNNATETVAVSLTLKFEELEPVIAPAIRKGYNL